MRTSVRAWNWAVLRTSFLTLMSLCIWAHSERPTHRESAALLAGLSIALVAWNCAEACKARRKAAGGHS